MLIFAIDNETKFVYNLFIFSLKKAKLGIKSRNYSK